MNVYYVADVRHVLGKSPLAPAGVDVRTSTEADVPTLADLNRRAYDPASVTHSAAVAEMQSAFDGDWGVLWPEASPAAWIGDHVVGVVQTVRRPSWDGTDDCPWIIEVFTDPKHRRSGFARALIRVACRVIEASNEQRVGLTVDDDNTPAIALYRSLGFVRTP